MINTSIEQQSQPSQQQTLQPQQSQSMNMYSQQQLNSLPPGNDPALPMARVYLKLLSESQQECALLKRRVFELTNEVTTLKSALIGQNQQQQQKKDDNVSENGKQPSANDGIRVNGVGGDVTDPISPIQPTTAVPSDHTCRIPPAEQLFNTQLDNSNNVTSNLNHNVINNHHAVTGGNGSTMNNGFPSSSSYPLQGQHNQTLFASNNMTGGGGLMSSMGSIGGGGIGGNALMMQHAARQAQLRQQYDMLRHQLSAARRNADAYGRFAEVGNYTNLIDVQREIDAKAPPPLSMADALKQADAALFSTTTNNNTN